MKWKIKKDMAIKRLFLSVLQNPIVFGASVGTFYLLRNYSTLDFIKRMNFIKVLFILILNV